MRIITLFSLLAILLFSCESKTALEITGNYAVGANKSIYLKQTQNNKLVVLDSAIISETGEFSLIAEITNLDFYTVTDDLSAFIVLAKPGSKISASFGESLGLASNFSGPEESTKFWEVNAYSQELNTKREDLNKRFQEGNLDRQTAVMEFNQINQDWQEFARKFVEENPSSPAVLSTLNAFHPIEDIEIFRSTLTALKPKMGQSDFVKRLEQQLMQNEKQVEQYEQQKRIEAERDKILAAGNVAPEINLPTPEGKNLKLSDLRGKYVLVDFWASWCKPCRAENPNVVAAYKKYKNKGFEILSVSLDKNKTAWTNAIKADKMDWYHVSDLKFWQSQAAQTYGVSSIPFTLLLDKEGKILAKNLRGSALHSMLDQLLNS